MKPDKDKIKYAIKKITNFEKKSVIYQLNMDSCNISNSLPRWEL